MKRFHQTLQKVVPVLLLGAASGFAGSIGSFAEATTDASLLITSDWGIPQGSFVLALDQLGNSAGAVQVVSPTITTSSATVNSSAQERVTAPTFIMQPNLGFQVILTADYSYQGPEGSTENPGKIVLAVIASEASSLEMSRLGVSSEFADAPISTDVSSAGMLYMGDSLSAPTVLTSSPTSTSGRPLSATPTADSSVTGTSFTQGEKLAAAAAISNVPEPSTSIGVSLGLLGLGFWKYRSKRG